MSQDTYGNFVALSKCEVEGSDYAIRLVRQNSPIAVIAPHGGHIERGTSELAKAIAQESFNLYCFDGLKAGRPHSDLHITSTRFDEPNCLDLVQGSDVVIAVHGRADEDDLVTTWLGGLDSNLRDEIARALKDAGFPTRTDAPKHRAQNRDNICNKGRRQMGVQLEIPLSLRLSIVRDRRRIDRFADAVRGCVVVSDGNVIPG